MGFKMKGFPMIEGTTPVKKLQSSPLNQGVMHTDFSDLGGGGGGPVYQGPTHGGGYHGSGGTSGGELKLPSAKKVLNLGFNIVNPWKKVKIGGQILKGGGRFLKSAWDILTSKPAKAIYIGTAAVGTGVKIAETKQEKERQKTSEDISEIPKDELIKNEFDKLGIDVNEQVYKPINKLRMDAYGKKTLTKKQNKELRANNQQYDDLMANLNSVVNSIDIDTTYKE